MAMGTPKMREGQEGLWCGGELATAPGHPFYKRLNEVLDKAKFDRFCEKICAGFYHRKLGRPSLPPGQYFRIMMIGFFEGLNSERAIAWRLADSLTLRQFPSIGFGREDAGSYHHLVHSAADPCGHPSTDLQLCAGAVGASRTGQRQDDWG